MPDDPKKLHDAEAAVRSITPPATVSPIMSVADAKALQAAFIKSAEATLEIAASTRDMVRVVNDSQGEHNVTRADNRRTRRTIITSHVVVIALLMIFLGLARSDANRTYAQAEVTRDQLVATLKAVQASSVAQADSIVATQALKAVVGVEAKDNLDDAAKASAADAIVAAVQAQETLAPDREKPAIRAKAAVLSARARVLRSEVSALPLSKPDAAAR